jgi:hypothetical protein
MAVQKNTNDLLTQALSTLPNNTTQQISPLDVREMVENLAASMFNKITDAPLVGLKAYSTLVTYESGQGCTYLGAIYIANQVTGPGAFNAAHWTLFVSGSGTVNKLAKFSATGGAVADSTITDNGTNYLFSLLSTNGFVKTIGGTGQLSVIASVAATEGGTGKTSWTVGSLPYISETNTFSEILAGTNGLVLTMVAGVPTWAAAAGGSNIGSSSLTITDETRYLRLKTGYGSGQFFQIQNTGGENLIKWIGNGTTESRGQFFFNAAVNGGQELYVIRAKSHGGLEKFRVQAEDNQGIIDIWGNQAYQLISLNSTGTSYFYNSLALGGPSASARLDVTGTGSTSATSTALFKNSSSENILTLKDDKSATFGGDVVLSQSNDNTAAGVNARIASHPTSTIVVTNASLTSIGSIIAGVAGGHLLTIMNETGAAITIVDAYGSAAAGEVIYTNTASNLTIRNKCGATFQYNATGACWTKI